MKKCKKGIVLIALSVAIACFSAGCVGDGLKDKFEDWFDKSESVEESGDVEDTSSSSPEQSVCAHEYGKAPTSVVAATCTTDGREVYKCTKCGEEKTEILEKFGHNVETHAAQAATCTEIGWAEYQTCRRCDYTTYEEIPALGHNVETHAAQAATCTEIGWAEYQTCTRCDYTTYEEIPALGHDYEGGVCTRCNEQDPDYVVSEGLAYTLNDDGESYAVGIGTCTDTDIIIPSTYEGKPVAYIANNGFVDCVNLTSIVIPDGVTSIGPYAFHNCSSLSSINIPDGVTSIGDGAFKNCSSLTSIDIPDSVTTIGGHAFELCTNLTSIVIPNSITNIGNSAFYACRNLTSVMIGNSVTNIGPSTFEYCRSLQSIVIFAETPPTLGQDAIPSNVQSIYVPQSSKAAYQEAPNWNIFASKIVSDNL